MIKEKILIVDDQAEINELIQHYLTHDGYDVISTLQPLSSLSLVKEEKPDLIILDVLMPDMDGIELCRELRKITHVPILFISCRVEDIDKIVALDVGGDDYITKPFSPRELVARVKAHLRRNEIMHQFHSQAPTTQEPNLSSSLIFENIEINPDTHMVISHGHNVMLSAKEFALLHHLARSPHRIYSIEQLFEIIWGSDSLGDTRTVMVHISNLRKKIEINPANPQYILTIRGVGYKFIGQNSQTAS
jgi:DNA-binding response OmpR family regulator